MTDWDEIEREVAEANRRMNDEALASPRYQAKQAKLRAMIEAGVFDVEEDAEDESWSADDEDEA